MPIVDSDKLAIVRVGRTGRTGYEIEFAWTDSAGEYKGRYTTTFVDDADVQRFVAEQTQDDMLRALMLSVLRRADNVVRLTEFDALAGTTLQVQTRVQAVTP